MGNMYCVAQQVDGALCVCRVRGNNDKVALLLSQVHQTPTRQAKANNITHFCTVPKELAAADDERCALATHNAGRLGARRAEG